MVIINEISDSQFMMNVSFLPVLNLFLLEHVDALIPLAKGNVI